MALFLIMVAASALQATPATGEPQRLDPLNCSAAGNVVTSERLRFGSGGARFRFSGQIVAGARRADDFAPRAMISLLQEDDPSEELSAVLSVQPARRNYDVTVRRLINEELRERSIVGHVRANEPVPFEIEVTAGREAVFRLGRMVSRVPLRDLDPSAIVLGCGSGDFQFENLRFEPRS